MLYCHLPLSLITLIFAFIINTTVANENNIGKEGKWVDLFAVDYPIVAYVHDSTHHAHTTYHIACHSDTPTASCPFAQPYTLIQGPSTLSFEFTAPLPTSTSSTRTQSFTLACSLDFTTSMACQATGLADVDTPVTTSQSFTYTGAAAQAFFKEVQIVTQTKDLLTHTPGASAARPTITEAIEAKVSDGVFLEEKEVVSTVVLEQTVEVKAVETSSSVALPVATGTKNSGAGRLRAGFGLF